MCPPLIPQVRVFPSLSAASSALARHLGRRAATAVRLRGRFRWVICGGATPTVLFERMATRYRTRFPWSSTEVYFSDERCVPLAHPESNAGQADRLFLREVPIDRRRVHRFRGELRPTFRAAAEYDRLLRGLRALGDGEDPPPPLFDVVLLGIGPDGHTASLFPGSPALKERRRLAVAVARPGRPPFVPRLTLTYPALARSREVCFLVAGADKAPVVARLLSKRSGPAPTLPAALVRPVGPIRWFLDDAAAARLPRSR